MNYTLVLTAPLGSTDNPEVIETLGEITATLEAGSQDYNYSWTATADGMLVVNMPWDGGWYVSLYNQTSYAMTDALTSADGLYVTAIAVKKDDVVVITVNTFNPDDPWNAPAGTVTFTPSYVAATQEAPYEVSFKWNEDGSASATVSVNAGATFYFMSYQGGGMVLSINGEEYGLLTGNFFQPSTFSITNTNEYAMNYTLVLTAPLGSIDNPAELVLGENMVTLEAGNQGYCYTWTATAAGTLTITINGTGWTYTINNLTTYVYGDTQWSDSEPVVNPATITVAEGDTIQIMIGTYDPASPWDAPAGTITFVATFA